MDPLNISSKINKQAKTARNQQICGNLAV